MTIRIIDTETTGVDFEKDRVCEIASIDIVKVSDKYTVTNVRSQLVNPGIPIPAQASAVHHLIDADVASAPSLDDVMEQFAATGDNHLFCVAHNAAFEVGFLSKAFDATETKVAWICTYKAALRVWPELPKHSNQFLRYHLGLVNPFGVPRENIEAHRALGDCYVTGCIFLALLQRAKFSQLLEWSAQPALHTVLTFGKHKGARYDAAPRDYLEWIVNKSDMDADTKFSATHWLNQKVTA